MEGAQIGPYRVLGDLGSGGMGKVYLAEVTGPQAGLADGSRVALKVIHPHLLETPGFFKRFLREAEIGQSVEQDNVVRCFDCDALLVDGQQQNFLVMEYVEGQTLRALLTELGRVPEELCRHIGREVAKGLVAIHEAGAVHRDLKPENVLITEDHVVKVMDLGVARLQDEAIRLSQTGAFVGSLEYAAPEQFRGEGGDPRGGLYALGVLLYELATGQHPYRAGDAASTLRNVLDGDLRRAGDVNPQLSPFLEEVVHTLATRALAAERPTVVLIDDLHFAPVEGRALFASLALAAPEHRVLLVGTMRPGVSDKWIANVERQVHATRSVLTRLGPKDLGRLLRDAFRSDRLAEELGFKIAEKSDGNPFFAFEIIRGLKEGRFITQTADGTWVTTQVIQDIQVPSSVLDLVQARIADLDEVERELLDVAACCGSPFDPGLVADALGERTIPTLRRLAHLQTKHHLVCSSGRHFVFDHLQVQEAIYGALPVQLRESYHAAIGEALETRERATERDATDLQGALCVDLCEHHLKGARGAQAVRYLDAALDHLGRSHLNDRAIVLADAALDASDLLAGRARLAVLLAKNARLGLLGRRAPQEEVLAEARVLANATGEPGERLQPPRPPRGGTGVLRAYARGRPRVRTPTERGVRPRRPGRGRGVDGRGSRGPGSARGGPRPLPGDRLPERHGVRARRDRASPPGRGASGGGEGASGGGAGPRPGPRRFRDHGPRGVRARRPVARRRAPGALGVRRTRAAPQPPGTDGGALPALPGHGRGGAPP